MHRALWAPNNWLDTSAGTFWYWVVLKLVLWIAPALWIMRRADLRLVEVIGIKRWRQGVLWGVGTGILLLISVYVTKAAQNEPYVSVNFGPAFWSSVILAPFAETLVFRGLVFGYLRQKVGFVTTAIVTSVLSVVPILPGWYVQDRFGYMVSRPFGGLISLVLLGLVYAYVIEQSKSATSGWLAQTINNYANL